MREKNIVLLLEIVFVLVVCLVITSFRTSGNEEVAASTNPAPAEVASLVQR